MLPTYTSPCALAHEGTINWNSVCPTACEARLRRHHRCRRRRRRRPSRSRRCSIPTLLHYVIFDRSFDQASGLRRYFIVVKREREREISPTAGKLYFINTSQSGRYQETRKLTRKMNKKSVSSFSQDY